MQKKTFNMTVLEHSPTGWLIATSDELPELLVQGKDLQQIRERAPGVVKRILERKGKLIEEVRIDPPAPETPTHFVTRELVAVAFVLEAA
ncbi:hypothetical protein [Rhizobium laguerreae]|uniref:hypothetical protein n=1 Tax=Rhizobium laguerreae TaxID=1076926 RepID=UPI001C91F8EA|nr:hypothetical protein [Rhizobium laguerreae]MBY3378922.1 hypothetical protein [Rhizobium laguerreae]